MSQGGDVIMPEPGDAVGRLRMLMSIVGVLESLPGTLMSREVILLSVLLGDTMGVRSRVVQLGGPLVILVV